MIFIPSRTVCSYLWETACSQINFPFFLMFCLWCSNFLANINVKPVLGLNVWNDVTLNNSHPKPDYKIVYCSVKSMWNCRIGARGIEKAKTSTASLKRGKYLEKKSFWVNLSDLMSKFIFSELKAFFANLFSKDSSVSILHIYLHHLGRCTRQIKH